jgi:hypothetical protein
LQHIVALTIDQINKGLVDDTTSITVISTSKDIIGFVLEVAIRLTCQSSGLDRTSLLHLGEECTEYLKTLDIDITEMIQVESHWPSKCALSLEELSLGRNNNNENDALQILATSSQFNDLLKRVAGLS